MRGTHGEDIQMTASASHAIPTKDLRQLFDFCNERYFAGAIVPSPGFRLRYSRSEKLSGCFTYCLQTHADWEIAIARRLRDHPLALLSTLVHEMIHMLAHQLYRNSGNADYLDECAMPGRPFENKGHGAYFFAQMARLNHDFPELGITVKSAFGDALYDSNKIPPVRLLLVTIDERLGKGMIYRMHPEAKMDWPALRSTAQQVHGATDLAVLQVPGHLAEGFPTLRKDNAARVNMKRRTLRHFSRKARELKNAPGSVHLLEAPRPARCHISLPELQEAG